MARAPTDGRALFSERAFHMWLQRELPRGRSSRLSVGDDVAAISIGGTRVALLTTDAFTQGTHFWPDSPPRAIGGAVVGASLSDLAAKGGTPAAILLDLLIPSSTRPAWAQALVVGAERFARRFGCHIVGGDTKPSRVVSIVGTALGWGDSRFLAPRNRARAGDAIVVTGTVGRGGVAALELLDRSRPRERAIRALLDVRPRVREGAVLARLAHAMIDTSDGVAESVRLVAHASGRRMVVIEEQLPLAEGLRGGDRRRDRIRAAAFFGGDYELLATMAPERVGPATRALNALGCRVTRIGRVETGRGAWLETAGAREPMPPATWQPFESFRGRGLVPIRSP